MIEIWMKFMPIIETKFVILYVLTIMYNEILSWMTKFWIKNHLVGDNN